MKNQKDYRLPPPSTFIPPELLKIKPRGRPKKINGMTGKVIEEPVPTETPKVEEPALKTFTVTVNLGEKMLEGTGKSIFDALCSLERPVKVVGKTAVEVSDGTKLFRTMLMPKRARRIFSPHARFYVAREITYLMK